MVVIRKSMISTLSCVFAVALMGAVDVAPVQAQQYAGTSNSRQSSIGDIDQKKLNAQIEKLPGLNFGTIGLFGDAEVFVFPGAPRPFIYSLPQYADSGLSFDGVSYNEYLNLVANSYGLTDTELYKYLFLNSNSFSVANQANFYQQYGDLVGIHQLFLSDFSAFQATYNLGTETLVRYLTDPFALPSDLNDAAFDRAHQLDFLAGGGYFPLPNTPITPNTDPVDPPEFEPFPTNDPVATDETADPAADTSAATLLEGADVLTDDELADALDILNQASASQDAADSAPVVSVVPEPATLGLLLAGATALIGRRRH